MADEGEETEGGEGEVERGGEKDFWGEDGDGDGGLARKMLEFFGGLDFLES